MKKIIINKIFSVFYISALVIIAACSSAMPFLPQEEMQKLSNEEFRDYFIDRIDNVITLRALNSGGNEVVTKTAQGRTFRGWKLSEGNRQKKQ